MDNLLLLDAGVLLENKKSLSDGDAALEQLISEAERALQTGPFSVTNKKLLAPSGDKHDYMSLGIYWWPNPETADGLPYVRRDGVVNPEIENWDMPQLAAMNDAVSTLALAFFFTQEEKYAAHAADLLRAWFLDEATHMNPNLRYGQAIPGKTDGRGIGIIETLKLCTLPDAVTLLRASTAWLEDDDRALRRWFDEYLTWLIESEIGQDEAAARNNHGTWYDAQLVVFSLFVDRQEVAQRVLRQVLEGRIATQIEPDGSQPHELARTRSWDYSTMNLQGFFTLARAGEHMDIDLWNEQTSDGRGLRSALDFLAPYSCLPWPYPQLGEIKLKQLLPLLRQGEAQRRDEKYQRAALELPQEITRTDRTNLLFASLNR